MNILLYINGKFIETKAKQKVINPSTGETLAEVSVAGQVEVEAALAAARVASDNGPWPRLALSERKHYLKKIAQGILDHAGELAQLETLNTGKPIKESTFMDIPSAAKTFEYVADNFERYLIADRVLAENAECRLQREPLGVAVLIVPWNYPLLIACWKLASALAAGNTVVLKPSSLTPLTVLELAKIIDGVGLPPGVLNVINGSGPQIGPQLCSDARVDLISFTGSNVAGKQIITYSAGNVKKLLLELGGKSASIVCKDADLESAVNGSLCSIFLNQGQMCTAMSRIFVEDSIYDSFLNDFVAKAKRIKLGKGLDFESQMGPLISEEQRKRVLAAVSKAVSEGAKLLCGGKIPDAPSLKEGFFCEPTVLAGVTPAMAIFKEEVFGPVAGINKFSHTDEVVNLANASDFGLAAVIWSQDESKADAIAARLNAGVVWVNTYGMFHNQAPYGGFKQSGFGKELGREGFLEYTRLKNIIVDQTKDGKPLVNYWYGF